MLSIKNIIDLTVPQYLIITIFTPLSAWLLLGITSSFPELLFSIISLSMAMLAFNIINMIFDAKIDKISKPSRPIPSGNVSMKEAATLASIFCIGSILLAFYVNTYTLSLILIFFLISFLYTNPITYLRKYFWAPSVIGAVIYGIVPFFMAASISSKSINPIYPLFFASLIFFIGPSKDIEDMRGDKKGKIISLPILVGVKKTVIFIIGGIITLLVCMALLSLINLISFKFVFPSLASIYLFLWINKKYIRHINNPEIHEIIVTQSKFVTTNMVAIITIQILYGITSIL
ncbi:MAG: UbiA prenyltransferase family protein [Candidatus Aenigmarchaeota archaeon]|nr:UbiA prenyltransferase family protein [Candidatus Aenigmarchaeota archaeon]